MKSPFTLLFIVLFEFMILAFQFSVCCFNKNAPGICPRALKNRIKRRFTWF